MNIVLRILILIALFGVAFSFLPKFIFIQVKKLLIYHKYKQEKFKKKFYKVMKVYLILGITLGAVFKVLFSPIIAEAPYLSGQSSIHTWGFSFIVSFSLVIILRIATLLSKSKLLSKIIPKKENKKLTADTDCDYVELKTETESFLFSIFLSTLLAIMTYFFYKLVFDPQSILVDINAIQVSGESVATYAFFVLFVFPLCLAAITAIGELLLMYIGVRPNCSTKSDE